MTGGGQDFVRLYSERVYGIPPEQVVGTAGATKLLRQGRQAVPDEGANFASPPRGNNSPREEIQCATKVTIKRQK